jgi:GNAT superfamily N-acetyltransferase
MGELGYPTTEDEMRTRLENICADDSYRTFLAMSDGIVCGMIGTFSMHSYEHNDASGRILAFVVSEKMRGKGVGRQLITAAEQDFVERNVRRIAVYTRLTRVEAHKVYERFGYARNGWRFVKDL